MSVEPARYERHSRTPLQFTVDLERGLLGLDAYALGHWMVARADYSSAAAAPTIARTFPSLAEQLGWGTSRPAVERATRAAKELRACGWVEFEVVRGQRRPTDFRLNGFVLRRLHTEVVRTSVPEGRTSRPDANAHGYAANGAPEPPPDGGRSDVDLDTDLDTDLPYTTSTEDQHRRDEDEQLAETNMIAALIFDPAEEDAA